MSQGRYRFEALGVWDVRTETEGKQRSNLGGGGRFAEAPPHEHAFASLP